VQRQRGRRCKRWWRGAALASMGALAAGGAAAFEFDTGNPDVEIRWDNTIRYNLASRVQGQDRAILGNPNFDDGDRNFDKGSVFNRFDLLSEFDLVFKRSYGLRVSGAFWWDPAYGSLDNDSPQTSNTLVNGRPAVALSNTTQRYAEGPSGELLDAFAFANFDAGKVFGAGKVPVSVKVGQHTAFWGDSLLGNGAIHAISYGQYSLDLWKALATPGAEAKEIFRPRNGITLQVQPLEELTVAGQYFFNWEEARIPESGSYLAAQDFLLFGADSLIAGPGVPGTPPLLRAFHAADVKPKNSGDWGLSARWSPEWLDGTLGFYYRRSADILPQVAVTPGVLPVPAAACAPRGGTPISPTTCFVNPAATTVPALLALGQTGQYNLAFGSDINLYGLSLSKSIAGISLGSELSYRTNMPLWSDPVFVVPASFVPLVPGSIATNAVPSHNTPGARGDTWHGLVNAVSVLPKTPIFDTASLQAELTWNNWAKVTQNEAVFRGRSGYSAIDRVSKNYFGLAINFTPTWFQVFPGVDLLMPLSWAQGISGNSAVTAGGSKGAGQWGAGIAFDIYQKYRVDLKYVGFYGDYSTDANGNMSVENGVPAALSDRGFVAMTFKTTF
jgi:Protein of unknown function (DUF1302)